MSKQLMGSHMNRIIASIRDYEKKRRHAIQGCIESLKKYITEPDKNGEHHICYITNLKALKNTNETEAFYTPTIQDYLAGARSIFNLDPQMSASPLLDDALFHQSDREALRSDWQKIGDDLWSAYFSAEYTTLNMKEQK